MKRITSAFLAIANAAWLFSGQAQAQMKDLSPDVVVEKGLEPLAFMALQAAGVPQEKLLLRAFPPRAAGRAFCLSGKAFMLLSTAPLPRELEERCHASLRKPLVQQRREALTADVQAWLPDRKRRPEDRSARKTGRKAAAADSGSRQEGNRGAWKRVVQLELAREPLLAVQPEGAVPIEPDGRTLFLALAAWMPQRGRLVRNPYTAWSDLGTSLPDERILILLPENARKLVQDFLRRACERGVLPYWEVQRVAVGKQAFRQLVREKCAVVRKDDAVRFIKGDDAAMVAELQRHRGALALIGHGAWLQNRNVLRAAPPVEDTPSRPLILAVDRSNLLRSSLGVKVLEKLAQSVRETGLLPPPPEERNVLNKLLEEARRAGAGQKNEAGGEAAVDAIKALPTGARASAVPSRLAPFAQPPAQAGKPRAYGGVQVEPSPLPKADRTLDLNDLPPAAGQRP